jgi:cellobiose phosphorylase
MEYTFNDSQRSITIHRPDLPSAWINYLSNGRLHAFVSQAGGSMLWWKLPADGRLTRYRGHALGADAPGFYVYIRNAAGPVWCPTFQPVGAPLDSWSATHSPGATEFVAQKDGLTARLRFFIPPDFNALVWELELSNATDRDLDLDVFAYAELSQYSWTAEIYGGQYSRHTLKTWFDRESDALLYLFHHHKSKFPVVEDHPLVYMASSLPVKSFSGDRDAFAGNYRDERNPQAVVAGRCGNEEILSGEPCACLHVSCPVKAKSSRTANFFLGVEPGALTRFPAAMVNLRKTIQELKQPGVLAKQYEKMAAWREQRFSVFSCSIPLAASQRQINIWSVVNLVHVGRYERSINTTTSGWRGRALRDSGQDMTAVAQRDPEFAESILHEIFRFFQEEGGHGRSETDIRDRKQPDGGIRTDQHLWIPALAYNLVAETGNPALLLRQAPFLAPDRKSEGSLATVWEHLLAGIRFTESNLGPHGLPLTLRADWNDIIGKFSKQGRGESVFNAQLYVWALNYMIELANALSLPDEAARLTGLRDKQARAILQYAWNGKWWYRCFDDDGKPVGDENSEFGKIWINAQSWAVISGIGSRAQHVGGMDAVGKYLDTGIGLAKVWPGFKTWPDVADPFSGYNPGNGENGAIFCHSNTWAIMAEALLGRPERAWKYYDQLVPHNALQKIGLNRYKAEPYAWASNIIGPENPKHGWANVMHMTGAAAWMEIAATQYLLGVQARLNGLAINPCVPGWESFSISRRYRGCQVSIRVENPGKINKGVRYLDVDGTRIEGHLLPASVMAGKERLSVVAVMGTAGF